MISVNTRKKINIIQLIWVLLLFYIFFRNVPSGTLRSEFLLSGIVRFVLLLSGSIHSGTLAVCVFTFRNLTFRNFAIRENIDSVLDCHGNWKVIYSELSVKAVPIVLLFIASYLRESGFSAYKKTKNKCRNQLDVALDSRVQFSGIIQNLRTITKKTVD